MMHLSAMMPGEQQPEWCTVVQWCRSFSRAIYHMHISVHDILGRQSALVSGFASLGGFHKFWVLFSFMNPVFLRILGQLYVLLLTVVPNKLDEIAWVFVFGIEIGIYLFYLTMSLAVTTQPSWFWCQEPDPLEVERRDWNQQTRRQCGTIAACSFICFSINSSVASPVWLNCVREHLWWVTSMETVSFCFSVLHYIVGFRFQTLRSYFFCCRPLVMTNPSYHGFEAFGHSRFTSAQFWFCSFVRGPCQWQYYLSSRKTGRTQQKIIIIIIILIYIYIYIYIYI